MATDVATLNTTSRAFRIPSEREQATTVALMREFAQFVTWRNTFAGQWEEAASLIEVTSRNTFFYNNFNWPGSKKTEQQIDASGALALERFVAIADSLVTPKGQVWHGLEAGPDYDYLMKDRATRLWYEAATRCLFRYRYAPLANFTSQNSANWRSLGAFGNAVMFIDKLDGRHFHGARGLRYKAIPLGEAFFGENHQGIVDRMYRWFRLTAAQAAQKWGEENLPQQLHTALISGSQWPFNFLHVVKPREDYEPDRLDERALPFSSHYLSMEGHCLMQPEKGYRVFPFAPSRYAQGPNEVYGRGPAQIVLPALKTLNAQKALFLKQGHKAADPALLFADDGIANFDRRPGGSNPGGVNSDGKPMVHAVPTGDIQIAKEMMAEERALIDDVFFVSLFKVLSEHPNMTATQVIELVNEKGMLTAPTLGRQHSEYIGIGLVPREVDLLAEQGLLPEMPGLLREARGQYEVVDTSPLALARRTGQAAGFLRTVETVRELVNITQDMSLLDRFDFDTAIPEIAQISGSPERWMADDQAIAVKRKARAQQQQRQEAIAAAPAQAAMIKARAVAAEKAPAMLGQPQ